MRGLRSLLVSTLLVGCGDFGKDSGDDGTTDASNNSDRSIDLGACPDAGLPGADTLPVRTVEFAADVFLMGDAEDAAATPVHDVTLTRGFAMTSTEITQGQWQAVGLPNPSQQLSCASCPVEQLTWHEAAAFADALSVEDGFATCYACTGAGAETVCTPPDDPYACEGWRLPTEAEWEYVASRDSSVWAGSDDFAEVAWTAEAVGTPCPVGSLAPTVDGLFDLSGNVSEWTHDGYAAYPADAVSDPAGDNAAGRRVVRGGSVFSPADVATTTARENGAFTEAVPWRGFRLVRSL